MRHKTVKMGVRNMSPVRSDFIPFRGGFDTTTPPFVALPGMLRDAQNWEIGVSGGYSLIKGYERYDGQAAPSDAIYYILEITLSGSLAVGETITGGTSGATGVIAAIADDSSYLVITKVTGTWESGENVEESASVEAVTTSAAQASGASTIKLDAMYNNAAADIYRSDIAAVPGSGPIRGLAYLNDVTYAFRNNAGGTACAIYKSSSSGWTAVSLGRELAFTSGGTYEIAEGDTITGATSGATAVVTRVLLESGSWSAGTAAGKVVFASQTGTFQAENLDVGANLNVATIAGDSSAITLLPDGRFNFITYNFGNGKRLYGADGVNRGFEFDGSVFAPITTGMADDTPDYVWAHKNHLFFSFGGSLQHSGIKAPYSWSVITGAAELVIGNNITGFSTEGGSETGGALAIYSENTIHVLYGTSSADWNLVRYKDEVGARAYSINQVINTYFLDDRGITQLRAAQDYGNFSHSTISEKIKDWITSRRALLNDSCVVRDKNQIRMFFSDKYALYITFDGPKVIGVMPCLFADEVECIFSAEKSDGTEVIRFGSSDGMVYELDRGTSFDGDAIESYLVTFFNHSKSPRTQKDYLDLTLEVEGEGYAELTVGYELGYAASVVPQPTTFAREVEFSETKWDSFTWDNFNWDGVSLVPSYFEMEGSAENVSISIRTNSDYYAPVQVSGGFMHYRDRTRLRYSR